MNPGNKEPPNGKRLQMATLQFVLPKLNLFIQVYNLHLFMLFKRP